MQLGGNNTEPVTLIEYKNSMLYLSDVDLIKHNQWLNDHCILFWFEVLQHKLDFWKSQTSTKSKLELSEQSLKNKLQDLLFLQPGAAFMLQFIAANDLLVETEDNVFLTIKDKRIIFIPVVDASRDMGGGSHWSLLVYSDGKMYHLDSFKGSNRNLAILLTQRFSDVVPNSTPIVFEEVSSSPQQQNSYDCGLFVLANAQFIAMKYIESGKVELPTSDHHVKGKRNEMLRVISSLTSA